MKPPHVVTMAARLPRPKRRPPAWIICLVAVAAIVGAGPAQALTIAGPPLVADHTIRIGDARFGFADYQMTRWALSGEPWSTATVTYTLMYTGWTRPATVPFRAWQGWALVAVASAFVVVLMLLAYRRCLAPVVSPVIERIIWIYESPECANCGYDLRSSATHAPCPECGAIAPRGCG